MKKTIAIGCDHAGFEYKERIKAFMVEEGFEVKDYGTDSPDSVDYPDFAHPLSQAVEQGQHQLGILICGSGNGVAIAANKHKGIRAAICWTESLAQLARQHNDANVLCLGSRFLSIAEAESIAKTFLSTDFEGGRHQRRVDKISDHPFC